MIFSINKIYENIGEIQVQKQAFRKYDEFFFRCLKSCSGKHNIIPKINPFSIWIVH